MKIPLMTIELKTLLISDRESLNLQFQIIYFFVIFSFEDGPY